MSSNYVCIYFQRGEVKQHMLQYESEQKQSLQIESRLPESASRLSDQVRSVQRCMHSDLHGCLLRFRRERRKWRQCTSPSGQIWTVEFNRRNTNWPYFLLHSLRHKARSWPYSKGGSCCSEFNICQPCNQQITRQRCRRVLFCCETACHTTAHESSRISFAVRLSGV